jgi:hypothetical protein
MMTRGVSTYLTWADLLAGATTPGEVISVVRDFMATWTPQELASLPADCQPPSKFGLPEDIVLYTFMLVDHEMKERERDAGVLRMSAFFSEATRRITQLMSGLPQRPAANASRVSD